MSNSNREKFRFTCNVCDAMESFAQYRANHVCPWCGEGVMEFEEELDEETEG